MRKLVALLANFTGLEQEAVQLAPPSRQLVEKLGRGATGEVWKAVDRRTDEVVAAKLLREEHTSDQDLVGRFVRERSILTGLRHPHVVAVRDLVVEGDRLAIIMDFVDGGSLRDVLAHDGPLPPERRVKPSQGWSPTAFALLAAVLGVLATAGAVVYLSRASSGRAPPARRPVRFQGQGQDRTVRLPNRDRSRPPVDAGPCRCRRSSTRPTPTPQRLGHRSSARGPACASVCP